MEVGKIYDCFGRELEVHTCEYCGVTKPVQHWIGIENGRAEFNVLMFEYIGRDGHKAWKCRECAADIVNKLDGKET
jgi:NMD protein affecting ribosome stability and mRNA decay